MKTLQKLLPYVLIVLSAVSARTVSAQINHTVFLEVTEAEGDEHIINNNNRLDDPFNAVRMKVFLSSWLTPKIGAFVKFLYDDEASSSYGDKLRADGAYFLFRVSEQFQVKIGKIPSTLGSFQQRSYLEKNSLIGSPLLYQYRTALPGNSVILDSDILLARGQRTGTNIIYDACWLDGIELFSEYSKLMYRFSVSKGSYANPASEKNGKYQFAGWLGTSPIIGLKLGAGYSYGPYLTKEASRITAGDSFSDYKTAIFSTDFEYSFGHVELYSEWIHQNYTHNSGSGYGSGSGTDYSLNAYYAEGRLKITPHIYTAARFGGLIFSDITDPVTGRNTPWDYDLNRFEITFGYKITRKSVVKFDFQHNFYKDTPLDDISILAAQIKSEF